MSQTVLTLVSELMPSRLEAARCSIQNLKQLIESGSPAEDPYEGLALAIPDLHFASLMVFEDERYDPMLTVELNFDGPTGSFLPQLETPLLTKHLRAILRCCKPPCDARAAMFSAIMAPNAKLPLAPYLETLIVRPAVSHQGNRGLDREVATHAADLDERQFAFLIGNLEYLGSSWETLMQAVGHEIWRRQPKRALGLLEGDGPIPAAMAAALMQMPVSMLSVIATETPGVLRKAVDYRPELVEDPAIWSASGARSGCAWGHRGAPGPILGARCARRVRSQRPGRPGDRPLRRRNGRCGDRADIDPDRMGAGASGVATLLQARQGWPCAILVALSKVLGPRAVPNDYGEDPWLTAITSMTDAAEDDWRELSAYLLARALARRTRSVAGLIQRTFMTVHSALAADALSPAGWRILRSELSSWTDWDRCRMVREAVTDLFFDGNIPPMSLDAVTEDDRVFGMLVQQLLTRWGGRRYVKDLRRTLRSRSDARAGARLAIIDQAL